MLGILDNLSRLSRPLLPAYIRLAVRKPAKWLCADIDEEDLTTVLLNLVVNARDAIQDDGSITVSAYHEHFDAPCLMQDKLPLEAGDYVCLYVKDDGSGIPPDIVDRILEPFFTTKPVGLGSGLGLPMAARFAREAGGGLSLDTSAKGTTVYLYLPCAKTTEVAATALPSVN